MDYEDFGPSIKGRLFRHSEISVAMYIELGV